MLQHLYLLLNQAERKFFNTFDFLNHKSCSKVISIGNLTTGGTGKTPVLIELLEELSEKKVCVITRGYKSKYEKSFYILKGQHPRSSDFTDETILVNEKFPEVPVLIGKNRHHSTIMAEKIFTPQYILLDDGFQYRRLSKDKNLLLWDSMSNEADIRLLPFGRLREPVDLACNADKILLTRCEDDSENSNNLKNYWKSFFSNLVGLEKIIELKTECAGIFDHSGQPINDLKGDCIALSAIGKPGSFYRQLEKAGLYPQLKLEYRDHHYFKKVELEEVIKKSDKLPIVCTEKDMVKIDKTFARKNNIMFLRIRVRPVSGRSLFEELELDKV